MTEVDNSRGSNNNHEIVLLQYQVQLIQQQREREHRAWLKREKEHRLREQEMLKEISRTHQQLLQALTESHQAFQFSDPIPLRTRRRRRRRSTSNSNSLIEAGEEDCYFCIDLHCNQ